MRSHKEQEGPSVGALMTASHVSYANEWKDDDEDAGMCNECLKQIPDARIGKVNKTTFYVQSQVTGEIVLVNSARLTRKNSGAVSARLARLGAGLCTDCLAPHPASQLFDEDDAVVGMEVAN